MIPIRIDPSEITGGRLTVNDLIPLMPEPDMNLVGLRRFAAACAGRIAGVVPDPLKYMLKLAVDYCDGRRTWNDMVAASLNPLSEYEQDSMKFYAARAAQACVSTSLILSGSVQDGPEWGALAAARVSANASHAVELKLGRRGPLVEAEQLKLLRRNCPELFNGTGELCRGQGNGLSGRSG